MKEEVLQQRFELKAPRQLISSVATYIGEKILRLETSREKRRNIQAWNECTARSDIEQTLERTSFSLSCNKYPRQARHVVTSSFSCPVIGIAQATQTDDFRISRTGHALPQSYAHITGTTEIRLRDYIASGFSGEFNVDGCSNCPNGKTKDSGVEVSLP